MMGSIPRCPLCSNYLVFSKNNSYFVGIKTLLKRDIIKFVAFDINLVPLIKWGVKYCRNFYNLHQI